MTRPRLVMITSLSTAGMPRSSILGMVVVMTRSTMPMLACWTNALQRKRPIPAGAMAKLHSLFASNSAACLSFMIERASSAVCCAVSAWFETGVILPSTFIAGGKPTVMKRSEPFFCSSSRSRSYMNLVACSRSITCLLVPVEVPLAGERVLVSRLAARFGRGNDISLHKVLQILIERLHAELLAGLDGRVHLRHLGLADEVVDGRSADHDLVRGDAPGAVLGLQQSLRDDRLQGRGDHRAYHLLLRGGEHVDDAVDGFRRARSVQRAEHQVAGLRSRQRQADRLQVAHLPHQDHVRVF